MNQRKLLLFIAVFVSIMVLSFCAYIMLSTVCSVKDDIILRWTMIGAIGSWAGSLFGAIALIISFFAFWLPQRVKLKVVVNNGVMISQMPGIERIDAYVITVKNMGLRAVTVNNVYLNFGGKKMGDIYVGILNQGSILQPYTPTFPKRLDQGESFDYYLIKDKLINGLRQLEEKTSLDTPLFVRVDEVTTGNQYHKTPWTLRTIIG